MTIPFSKTKASAMLDVLRGLAALLVCVSHWRNIFFVDYGQRIGHSSLAAPFYLLTSCGHQAVVVFFVLSGYLVAGSMRRLVARGAWSWRGYGVQRLTRLWVVLVPGLLFGAIWDRLGMRSGWAPLLYGGMSGNHIIGIVARDYNWAAFWHTLLFLQGILGRSFGSNAPLWSVGYEFWYYVLFPLGFFVVAGRVQWRFRIGFAGLLVAIAMIQSREMLFLFPIWLAGAALTFVPQCRAGAIARWAALVAYVPVFLLAGRFGQWIGPPTGTTALLSDYGIGLATAGLVWTLLSARKSRTDSPWERAGHGLARFSFTLYVTHTPLLVLLAAWAGKDRRWQPDASHLLGGSGLLVGVLGFAWAAAWATEFRTDDVRQWLGSRIESAGRAGRSTALSGRRESVTSRRSL